MFGLQHDNKTIPLAVSITKNQKTSIYIYIYIYIYMYIYIHTHTHTQSDLIETEAHDVVMMKEFCLG